MNKKERIKQVLALAGAIVLLGGCAMFPEEEEALAPPLIEPTEITYDTAEATLGTISEEVSDTCTVVSSSQYSLSFGEQSGVLRSKEVTVGDYVERGQVLAKLDSGNAETELANAQLSLQIQQINLERALAKGKPDEDRNGKAVNFDAQIIQLQIKQTQLQINSLSRRVSNATLYAPVSGVVTYMTDASVGDMVPANSSVCQVADLTQLEFEYTGNKANKLKLGMEAVLTIGGQEYTGTVAVTRESVPQDRRAEFDSKVRFSLDEAPEVTLGTTARFLVVTAVKEDAVIVPRGAVTGYTGSYYVRVYQDGVVSERVVEVGLMSSKEIEIIKGVEPGEKVVVR